MSTRTIVTVQLEVHDAQPYEDNRTAAEIREHAVKGALRTIDCLNRSDLRVVGTPKATLVISEDPR